MDIGNMKLSLESKCIQCKKKYYKGYSTSFCTKNCCNVWKKQHEHIPYQNVCHPKGKKLSLKKL